MVKIREAAWGKKAGKKNGCFKNNILKSYIAIHRYITEFSELCGCSQPIL